MVKLPPPQSVSQQLITFKAFFSLARQRSWTVSSLAARFRGKIQNPTKFFSRVLDGETPDALIPYRSVIELYRTPQTIVLEPDRHRCACGCGRIVFDRKKWAAPGCKKKLARKRVRDEQNRAPELFDFVDARPGQNRGMATLPLTDTRNAL